MRILLVEDDPDLGPAIARALRAEHCAVDLIASGIDAQHLGDTVIHASAVQAASAAQVQQRTSGGAAQAAVARVDELQQAETVEADGSVADATDASAAAV